jgi:hypothetical protein
LLKASRIFIAEKNTKSFVSPPRDLCPPADDGAAPGEVSGGHQVPGPHRVVRQGDQGQLGHYVLLLFLKNSGKIYIVMIQNIEYVIVRYNFFALEAS